jgi:hypothetical protein
MQAYYLATTHNITVSVEDNVGLPVTGAVVVVTLVTLTGSQVTGQAWPLALTDQGDGTYRGAVSHALQVTKADKLRARITATKSGAQAYAEPTIKVVVDGS